MTKLSRRDFLKLGSLSLGSLAFTPSLNNFINFDDSDLVRVACEVGLAVLDVLERERLQDNALRVGQHLLAGLRALLGRHPIVGDVRGQGLFVGVELVRDRATLEPAGDEARYVVNRLRDRGILTGTDGPYHNVIKIRPPLVFTREDADHLVAQLDGVLSEDPLKV